MTASLTLPKSIEELNPQLIIFQCANHLGTHFGNLVDSNMKSIRGENWLKELGVQRQQYKINIYDLSFLIKEVLRSDSVFRQFLPTNASFFKKIEGIKRLRNETSHNEFSGDIEKTKNAVELFFEVALELNLSECTTNYASLIQRMQVIQSGTFKLSDAELSSLSYEDENLKAEAEDKLAAQSEEIRSQKELLDKSDEQIEVLKRALLEQNRKIQELASTSESTKEEDARTRAEIQKLVDERERLERQKLIFAENIQTLNEEKEQLQQVVKLFAEIILDDEKVEEFRDKLNYDNQDSTAIEFNSSWNGEKGRRKITLSVKNRDLIDPKTNSPIAEISEEHRRRFAQEWLAIRPSGGRLFVDDEGFVSTLINDELVLLDRVPGLSAR